jgi:hypothetical protein
MQDASVMDYTSVWLVHRNRQRPFPTNPSHILLYTILSIIMRYSSGFFAVPYISVTHEINQDAGTLITKAQCSCKGSFDEVVNKDH